MPLPQVSNLNLNLNLRLLIPLLSPLKPSFSNLKPINHSSSLFTVFASKRHRNVPSHHQSLKPNLPRRNTSTLSSGDQQKVVPMEEMATEPPAGFNKRRAEGRDKNDRPHKNLQLKSRKLNPVNTISYVQVFFFFFFRGFEVSAFWVFFVMWFCKMGLF